ncbi:D(5)-like dopamine receptor [Nibea albiflora]|uniref:D(5)-like dopamine receptor n=1 Tax=Nibea albiflora TaxID=240163 RepID=A0ACB7EE79_NIBAL|nr:D(5)-like dopamine receptor [Nibea albiflora]
MPWEAITEVTGTWLFGRFCEVWIAFDIMCSHRLHLEPVHHQRGPVLGHRQPVQVRAEDDAPRGVRDDRRGLDVVHLDLLHPGAAHWHQAGEEEAEEVVDVMAFYIPVVIMIATYTRIYRIAQTQIRRITSLERAAEQAQNQGHGVNRNQHQQHRPNDEASLKSSFKKETKVLKTLSIIMGVFVFCWLPFFVLNCTVPFCDPPCVSDTTFTVFVWFGWANSSLNPVIYAFNADFRRAFATILGCNQICSSNAVEAVNFSDELVSYHHDTTLHKEALVPAQLHPRTIDVGSDRLEDVSAQLTRSRSSPTDPRTRTRTDCCCCPPPCSSKTTTKSPWRPSRRSRRRQDLRVMV